MTRPSPHVALEGVLRGLFDKPVKVAPGPAFEPSIAVPGAVAVYATDDARVVGVSIWSMGMAAYLGAALSLIPSGSAESEARKGALGPALLENLHEVANVCSQLVTELHGGRCQLVDLVQKVVAPPPLHRALYTAPKQRFDVEIRLPGYGSGPMSIRVA